MSHLHTFPSNQTFKLVIKTFSGSEVQQVQGYLPLLLNNHHAQFEVINCATGKKKSGWMWEVGCPCWLLSKELSMHGVSSGEGSCCLLEHSILDVLTLSSTAEMFTYSSYSLITSKYLSLFSVPSPKLFHVTLEAFGCSSEEQIK